MIHLDGMDSWASFDGLAAWVTAWNALAQRILSGGLGAAAASTLIALCATLIWCALRHRASAHFGAALFLLPLIPLALPLPRVLPLELPLPPSLQAFVSEGLLTRSSQLARRAPSFSAEATPAAAQAAPFTKAEGATARQTNPDLRPVANASAATQAADTRFTNTRATPSPLAVALLLWFLSSGALLLRFLARQHDTSRWLRRARVAASLNPQLKARVQRLARRSGLRRPVRVRICQGLSSPAAWGVLRPTLLLPAGLDRRLDEDQLDWVLLHELAHLARRDLALAALQRVVQIVWFFHPLVWWTNRVAADLREQACDEAALARLPQARPAHCAAALLAVAQDSNNMAYALALQNLTPGGTLMKNRIQNLLRERPHKQPALALVALPLLIAVGSLSLTKVSLRAHVALEPVGVGRSVAVPAQASSGAENTATSAVPHGPSSSAAQNGLPTQDEVIQVEEPTALAELKQAAAGGQQQEFHLVQVRDATRSALSWILAQQHEDGYWPTGLSTERAEGEVTVVGMTGLAILCLLEAERQGGDPLRAAAIERGLAWLAAHQEPDTGRFGLDHDPRMLPSHALATWAWIEAQSARPAAEWQEQARRALQYLLRGRNPYAGWRYDVPPVGDSDSVMTGFAMIALARAADAGLSVDIAARNGGLAWLNDMYDPATGRTGYNARGNPPSRLYEKNRTHPSHYSELCTAVAMTTRLRWGEVPGEQGAITKGANLLLQKLPVWDAPGGSVDSYYWAFGTDAMARLGGAPYEVWRCALYRALLSQQLPDGSWPGIDAWSNPDTTVHASVVHTWSLLRSLR